MSVRGNEGRVLCLIGKLNSKLVHPQKADDNEPENQQDVGSGPHALLQESHVPHPSKDNLRREEEEPGRATVLEVLGENR